MLSEMGIHRGTPDRCGNDQNFRLAVTAGDEPVRQARFKMRGIARLQIVSFAGKRKGQFAGQNINPLFTIVMIMLIAAARWRHFDPQGLDIEKWPGAG